MHLAIELHDAARDVVIEMNSQSREYLRACLCEELEDVSEQNTRMIDGRSDIYGTATSAGYVVVWRRFEGHRLDNFNDEHRTSYRMGMEIFDLIDAFSWPSHRSQS